MAKLVDGIDTDARAFAYKVAEAAESFREFARVWARSTRIGTLQFLAAHAPRRRDRWKARFRLWWLVRTIERENVERHKLW